MRLKRLSKSMTTVSVLFGGLVQSWLSEGTLTKQSVRRLNGEGVSYRYGCSMEAGNSTKNEQVRHASMVHPSENYETQWQVGFVL